MTELTWTEIAIQLTGGVVPASCGMDDDAGMWIAFNDGKTVHYNAKEVDDAIEELDEIARASASDGTPIDAPKAASNDKPTPAPKAASKSNPKPKGKP